MEEDIKKITLEFHKVYEELAPQFGYETRKDTKDFDFNSDNGKLMYATVEKVVEPILNELDRLQKENEELSRLNEKLEMEYNILLNAKVAIDIGSTESVGIEFLEEYIPKSVIQDKLNELKECDTSCLVEQIYNNGKKALCKELLNKGE